MIFTPNNKREPILLKHLKKGECFQSSLLSSVFCKCSIEAYNTCRVFNISNAMLEDWDVDQAVIPVEITEVKFNYV